VARWAGIGRGKMRIHKESYPFANCQRPGQCCS